MATTGLFPDFVKQVGLEKPEAWTGRHTVGEIRTKVSGRLTIMVGPEKQSLGSPRLPSSCRGRKPGTQRKAGKRDTCASSTGVSC